MRKWTNEEIFSELEYELADYRAEIETPWEEEYQAYLAEEKLIELKNNENFYDSIIVTLAKGAAWDKKAKHKKDYKTTYVCCKYQLLGWRIIHSGQFKHLKNEAVPASIQDALAMYEEEWDTIVADDEYINYLYGHNTFIVRN